ncbi:hypothetical protein [Candidatus Parabeggiatoa sp. HSG14]|uniref:hypothetical protein n=1 Tax=Candidatus Parabeggiatoa sp. HSG14 TaxID=3055593 RepID=UPI0025A7D1E6|nr:hypothetical protein [Thiotrichales bacterium HSG14]
MTLTDSPTPLNSGPILNGLLPTVKTLSHVDKIRLMHFLMTDLVQREGINLIEPDESYPIWTPLNAVEAADTLLKALTEENQRTTA